LNQSASPSPGSSAMGARVSLADADIPKLLPIPS
jgi:hypothetical protein